MIWYWARHGRCCLTATTTPRLCVYHLQHDQLPGAELVSEGNHGLLPSGHLHGEDVDAGVEAADLDAVLHTPQSDRVVARSGSYDVVVV